MSSGTPRLPREQQALANTYQNAEPPRYVEAVRAANEARMFSKGLHDRDQVAPTKLLRFNADHCLWFGASLFPD